jgi:hypothetical protein
MMHMESIDNVLSITWSNIFSVLKTKTQTIESCTLPQFMFEAPRPVLQNKETVFFFKLHDAHNGDRFRTIILIMYPDSISVKNSSH